MEWFILLFTFVAAAVAMEYRRRLHDIEYRLERVASAQPWLKGDEEIQRRLIALERIVLRPAEPVKPVVAPDPEPVIIPPVVVRIEEPVVEAPVAAPAPPPKPVRPPEPPKPGLRDHVREWLKGTEWEAFVGVSLLSKVGALLLVIGIALFLGYSFGHIGPAGRAMSAIAVSIALLVTGIRTESRPRFAVLARGLMGAGWAAMYATAYAIYAVPATQLITNAFAGSVVLFAVACGMIAHSLRYRAQALTAVTYFAAFAALAVTPATTFAVLSMIPLAASLLYLAYRFRWLAMALSGIAATYLTCISRGDSGAPLAASQALMLTYWLLFEAFDVMRMRRRMAGGGVEWIFPANALGFLAISYHAWSTHVPEQLWLGSAYGAALYLASAVARFLVRRPSSFADGEQFVERMKAGSFEGSVLISAVLAGLAIFGRGSGIWMSVELLVEAEVVYMAGVILRSGFLRGLGIGGFGLSLLQGALSADDFGGPAAVLPVHNWSPIAVLHAMVFYFNREVRRQGMIFSTMAAALIALVICSEAPHEWMGTGLAVFGVALLHMGLLRKMAEFRMQGLALTIGGLITTAITAFAGGWIPLAVCLTIAYALVFSAERLAFWREIREADELEWAAASQLSAACVAGLAALLTWNVAPREYVAAAWGVLMVIALEAGIRKWPQVLRLYYLAFAGLCAAAAIGIHPEKLFHQPQVSVWLSCGIELLCFAVCAVRLSDTGREEERDAMCVPAVIAASALAWMLAPVPLISLLWLAIGVGMVEISRRHPVSNLKLIGAGEAGIAAWRFLLNDISITDKWGAVPVAAATGAVFIAGFYLLASRLRITQQPRVTRAALWAAPVLFTALTIAQDQESNLAIWWAGGVLALLAAGRLLQNRDLRIQGYCLSALTLAAALAFDITSRHLAISIPVIAALYAARFLAGRDGEQRGPMYFSVSGTLVMALVLYESVSGGMLTVSWGIEGAVLLCAGFLLRDRMFRLQGLALALACTLKLFLYDLRNLDTPYRIVSFIALGAILLGASWVYSRFREQVRRIL